MQYDRFDITKWYLYGQATTPTNLVDEGLIVPSSITTSNAPDVNLADFMSTGAGRFAVGSQFELIQRFFALNVPEGNYSKNDLFFDVFGLGSFDPDPFFGWKMQQFNYDDGVNDYLDRVWVYNSMSFKISDSARFIVDQNGNKRIDNFFIEPISETEDFDFETSNAFTAVGNAAALGGIDPSGIGRKVVFKYAGAVPPKTYTEADFRRDFETSKSWKVGNTEAFSRIISQGNDFVDELFNEGATRFLDNSNRPILYGTVNNDLLLTAASITPTDTPTLHPFKNNGVVLIGAAGNDNIIGASAKDILLGGEGLDTLDGNQENDVIKGGDENDKLIGGQGKDKLDGGADNDNLDGGSGEDVAIFSDSYSTSSPNYKITTDPNSKFTTITHLNGGIDGTDTLKNIEFAQFQDTLEGAGNLNIFPEPEDESGNQNIFPEGEPSTLTRIVPFTPG